MKAFLRLFNFKRGVKITINYDGIKKQRFGIEIELTGITRQQAAAALKKAFNGSSVYAGGAYGKYTVTDEKSREWSVVSDSSIICTDRNGQRVSGEYSVETVSPILEYEDIPLLQEAVRSLRKAGGITGSEYRCGIHIHIDGAPYTPKTLRNLVNIFASKEDMLFRALQVDDSRMRNYCRKIDRDFLESINRVKPSNMEKFKELWYGDRNPHNSHYDGSRYRNLNLHSLFTNNNVEIRCANSTLHAGVIRAYICLALAISNQALTQKSANPRVTESTNPKYTFRTWLLRLGLNGEEFRNVRKHLLAHLEGCISWRNPEDAVSQRERIRQERQAEREQEETENESVRSAENAVGM